MDTVADHTKATHASCQNYRTVNLISHPGKVMLRVILNRLEEEQARFGSRRSTTEQPVGVGRKLFGTPEELIHNFVDFKKAFDRI